MPSEQLLDLLAQIDSELDHTKQNKTHWERSYGMEGIHLTYYQGAIDALLKARLLIAVSFRDNGTVRDEEE